MTEFCARIVALGLPLARGQVFIDTLHPVYGGRGYYWQAAKGETIATEYRPAIEGELLERWRRSAFYHMIETGSATLRRRLTSESGAEFPFLGEFHAAGMTDYFAVIDRFGADTIIGEMDGVYSSWVSDTPQGFTEDHIATLRRLTPCLALAIKSAALGRIARLWSKHISDATPAGGCWKEYYTVISCDRAQPNEIIPFLNDYAETVISAIHGEGGEL